MTKETSNTFIFWQSWGENSCYYSRLGGRTTYGVPTSTYQGGYSAVLRLKSGIKWSIDNLSLCFSVWFVNWCHCGYCGGHPPGCPPPRHHHRIPRLQVQAVSGHWRRTQNALILDMRTCVHSIIIQTYEQQRKEKKEKKRGNRKKKKMTMKYTKDRRTKENLLQLLLLR